MDGAGQAIQETDLAGMGNLMSKKLMDTIEIHDQDKQVEFLDAFWDTRRTSAGLQDFLLNFKQRYREAECKTGLSINTTGLTHLYL